MFPPFRFGKEFGVEQEPSEDHSANLSASGERKQPTYTTVGSIFNPDATTPIQPPTRRPRPRRHPQNFQSPIEASLILQTNLLAALPVQDTSPTSPTPGADRVPQYSQLQQNYDRAVSPPNLDEDNTALSGFGMSVPNLRSGTIPPPTFGLGIAFEPVNETTATREDEEAIVSDGVFPFKNHFSTQTLNNLASFPNPMQQAARDTLAKARSLSRTGRVDSSVSLPQMASEAARNRADSSFRPPPTNTGAPQPLKAGPPGQRQFIPSTFDGVSKAMKLSIPEIQPKPGHLPLPPGLVQPYRTSNLTDVSVSDMPKNASADEWGFVDLGGRPSHGQDSTKSWFGCKNTSLLDATVPILPNGHEDRPSKKIRDTLPFEKIDQYYPQGFSPDMSGVFEEISCDWIKEFPLKGNGYPSAPETEEERLARTNARFYSGSERYIRGMNQFQVENERRPPTRSIGVIGGERQRYQKRNDGPVRNADGKIQPRHISIEEANSMDGSAHAAPLLAMAYESLLEWKKASMQESLPGSRWGPQVSEPDPAHIDDSECGNSSFFSQERPDPAKKKKLFKKVRRGY